MQIKRFFVLSICSKNAAAFAAAFLLVTTVINAQPLPPDKSVAGNPATAAPLASTKPAVSTTAAPVTAIPANTAVPLKLFVTIGDRPAVLFDAPSNRANKIFIVVRLTPLELLVKLEKMTKVRDADGIVGWVDNDALGSRRHVQVFVPVATVRTTPSATGNLLFDAQRSVLLEVTGATTADGWLPVKHRDGQGGFIQLSQIWGG